jgi:ParB/RepB/Spo0J family partition protein
VLRRREEVSSQLEEQSQVVIQIPIDQIHPDPKQPRHLLPRDLAGALADCTAPLQVLSELRERGRRVKWIRERLGELDALADSISSDGLMDPIRVLDGGDGSYVIEAGERRWWAHHILLARADSRFEKIAAFVVGNNVQDSGVHRRRVAENVLRDGFTVMEMAQALETRLKEMMVAEPQLSGREVERRVGKENGMSDRRVRQYVALLKLPTQVQEIAQQERLSEGILRKITMIRGATRQIGAAKAQARSKARTSIRNKVEEKTRCGYDRTIRRKGRAAYQVLSMKQINQLMRLATNVDARHVRDASDALARRLTANLGERKALSNLCAVLTRALTGSVRLYPSPPSNKALRCDRRKRATR